MTTSALVTIYDYTGTIEISEEVLQTRLRRADLFLCKECGKYKHSSYRNSSKRDTCIGCAPVDMKLSVNPCVMHGIDNRHYNNSKKLYFGVEYEYDSNYGFHSDTDQVKAIYEYSKNNGLYPIVKYECGLDGEVNFVPETPEDLLRKLKGFWDIGIFKTNYSPEEVGMHIHVNRSGLGVGNIGKLYRFYNDQNHVQKIQKIAGRTGKSWARYLNNPPVYVASVSSENRIRRYDFYRGAKAYSISYRDYIPTLEFRLFAAPSNYEEFARRIEFLYSTILFLSPLSLGYVQNNSIWDEYMDYVKTTKRRFSHLYAFLY